MNANAGKKIRRAMLWSGGLLTRGGVETISAKIFQIF
jgi:hypothetical protein